MMILECAVFVRGHNKAVEKRSVYNGGKRRINSLETELGQVEQTIRDIADKTKCMADELGARYVVFRCSKVRYEDSRENHNTDIIALSRETDDCIETIYLLEQRRRELLRQIREMNG